ncbi:MAG: methyltransferase domain-containing protein [Verrucomicrobiota bacterium]
MALPDARFNAVVSTEVLEHLFNYDEILSELWRVLRPNGRLFLTTPFIWPEHEQPYDCARHTSFGLKRCWKSTASPRSPSKSAGTASKPCASSRCFMPGTN